MENMATRMVPLLIERTCGGWLAVSKPDAILRIGVTAETEVDAKAAFERAVEEWEAMLRVQPRSAPC